MAALLALASALSWGSADFLGGVQSRRLSSVAVALWSQVAGAVALLVVLLFTRQQLTAEGFAWGVTAGLGTGAALTLFYRGLSGGAMAIIAPISACAAVVPVAAAFLFGEVPSGVQFGGFGLCLAGAITISIPNRQGRTVAGSPLAAVGLGLAAALGFGLFYVLVDRGSEAGGSALWVVGGARVGSLATILLIAGASRAAVRITPRALPLLVLTGVLDTGANVLFVIAATKGTLGVVSVLGSLYPVATVALATVVSREALTAQRVVGGAIALAGVAVLSAG